MSSLSSPFGPSPFAALPTSSRRVAIPVGALVATTASADFSLRPHRPSPFQARGEISPGKGSGLRPALAGYTSTRLGRGSFAVVGPLTPRMSASNPVPVRRAVASLSLLSVPASRPTNLASCLGRYDLLPRGLAPPDRAHAGHTDYGLRPAMKVDGCSSERSRGGSERAKSRGDRESTSLGGNGGTTFVKGGGSLKDHRLYAPERFTASRGERGEGAQEDRCASPCSARSSAGSRIRLALRARKSALGTQRARWRSTRSA